MTEHSPQPWEWVPFTYSDGSGGDYDFESLVDANGQAVILGYSDNMGDGHVYCNPADVPLTQTAPELLEALKGLLEVAIDLDLDESFDEDIERAEKAIAKADGEERDQQ